MAVMAVIREGLRTRCKLSLVRTSYVNAGAQLGEGAQGGRFDIWCGSGLSGGPGPVGLWGGEALTGPSTILTALSH